MPLEQIIYDYQGSCLCGHVIFSARAKPINPHLCSCLVCQKSSGAPTVCWVEFPLAHFTWIKNKPALYRSSEKTQRCYCDQCGSFLGAIDDGYENISITIASLENKDDIIPTNKHSYKSSAPKWWNVY